MIITILLAISLALIIYSVMKGRKMMSVLLKFMMLAMLVMTPALSQEESIGLVGILGIPEPVIVPDTLPDTDDSPVIIPIPDAVGSLEDADAWTASAYAFLCGNETMVKSHFNNTTLVIA